ncbi:MAG TPA: hypothetical protein VE978_28610 [Chitinophagales bacterium]|nr:hypothetical protein [Chitinophagales bacterium]
MKLLSSILLLAYVSFAFCSCNFSQGKQMKFVTHKEAADTQRIAVRDTVQQMDTVKEIPVEYGMMSKENERNLLKEVHLEKLILSKTEDEDYPPIYNGFFGNDHYRIEFYISDVQSDTANPFVFQVKGKDRFKKNITPFTGIIKIDSLLPYKDFNYDYAEYLEEEDSTVPFEGDTFIATCHIKGTFELHEDSNAKGSGVYAGKIFIDVVSDGEGGYRLWFNTENETRRGGVLMDAMWTSNTSKEQKPMICARDLFMFANDILEDFSYGEREIEINKKYRSLGWDNYWENDEWWGEGEKVTLMIWDFWMN